MFNEIERKFLIKKMPDLKGLRPIWYERYYIFKDEKVELRIQKKDEKYEIERKEIIDKLKAIKNKLQISKKEFNKLKEFVSDVIIREGYFMSSNPDISVKIYHGKWEGLKKVEVEFKSKEEARNFKIPKWFGKEITDSIISRDSKLLDLDEKKFKVFLKK